MIEKDRKIGVSEWTRQWKARREKFNEDKFFLSKCF